MVDYSTKPLNIGDFAFYFNILAETKQEDEWVIYLFFWGGC